MLFNNDLILDAILFSRLSKTISLQPIETATASTSL